MFDGGSITLVIFVIILTLLWLRSRRPSDLPPGPTPLPLLGNIPTLLGGSLDLLKITKSLRKQHGNLYSLSVGPYWIVFVNGHELLKEAFIKNADVLSDRPDTFSIKILSEQRGIVSSSGHRWKSQRTFALAALRSFGFGKRSMENKIMDENKNFMDIIENHDGRPFCLAGLINRAVSNVICSITFGKTFSHDDQGFAKAVEIIGEEIGNPHAGVVDMLPILQYLPGDFFYIKRSYKNKALLEKAAKEEIEEHKQTLDENDARDFIDAFLIEVEKHKKEEGAEHGFEDNQLEITVLDLFAAGTETTSTTITWAVLFLMRDMDIQKKMKDEIEDVLGSNRAPNISDKPNMPYCNAVISETQRLGNIVPLSLFHKATEDLIIQDKRIPKGAIVIPVLDSVMYDEDTFPNPMTFDPTRFIDEAGKYCNQDKILPFSLGRRVCLGESLARMELFLFLTSMVQKYQFLPPEGETPPEIAGIMGVTHGPLPYKVRCVPWPTEAT